MDGDKALRLLDAAITRSEGQTSRDEVLGELLSGRATVFPGKASVMICTLHEDQDGKREGHVWLAAGNLSELRGPLREQAEQWARLNGADTASIDGRDGWARALRGVGFIGTGEIRKVL